MVRYVMLIAFTEIGASQIQNTTKRAQAVRELGQSWDIEFESIYWTPLGEHDAIMTIVAPNEEAAIAFSAYLTKQGYVSPRLQRAFTASEYEAIISRVPASQIELDAYDMED